MQRHEVLPDYLHSQQAGVRDALSIFKDYRNNTTLVVRTSSPHCRRQK
jgi:hypothetical protein